MTRDEAEVALRAAAEHYDGGADAHHTDVRTYCDGVTWYAWVACGSARPVPQPSDAAALGATEDAALRALLTRAAEAEEGGAAEGHERAADLRAEAASVERDAVVSDAAAAVLREALR